MLPYSPLHHLLLESLDRPLVATSGNIDDLLRQAWTNGINSPYTSAVGRLFDAAAVFTGTIMEASYEGEGPMRLEARCGRREVEPVELPLAKVSKGLWRSDWAPLIQRLTQGGPGEETQQSGLLAQRQIAGRC